MGQYGNQPDYAVKAVSLNIAAGASNLNSAALVYRNKWRFRSSTSW